MNVHIRCKGNVAPNCGVNSVELANKLAEMGLQAGGLAKRNSVVQRHFPERVKSVWTLLKHKYNEVNLCFVFVFLKVKNSEQVRVPTERRESTASQQHVPRLGISNFTFLQVLGKGSFGKVGKTRKIGNTLNYDVMTKKHSTLMTLLLHLWTLWVVNKPRVTAKCGHVVSAGDAGQTKQQRPSFCSQGVEEGHHFAGWWCWVHHDRKEGAVTGWLSSLPHTAVLLLPDAGQYTDMHTSVLHFNALCNWCSLCVSSHSISV